MATEHFDHDRLRALLESRGWSVYKLAQVTGCTQAALGRLVNGLAGPNYDTAVKISEALGVGLDYFRKS